MMMALPANLDVALKEWATTTAALQSGRQILLLRKGGILEQSQKNRFAITHNEFLLFPTYLHQSRGELKPEVADVLEAVTSEPATIQISSAGVVTDIFKVESRGQVDRLDEEHIWSSSLIDMRFNYKPQNPLFLVLVRVYRLQSATSLQNTPAYSGCKSWVPLDRSISVANATAVFDDATYDLRRKTILEKMKVTL